MQRATTRRGTAGSSDRRWVYAASGRPKPSSSPLSRPPASGLPTPRLRRRPGDSPAGGGRARPDPPAARARRGHRRGSRQPLDVGRDHGHPARHRGDRGLRPGLEARGHHQEVGAVEPGPDPVLPARKHDDAIDPEVTRESAEPRLVGSREENAGRRRREPGDRLEQQVGSLSRWSLPANRIRGEDRFRGGAGAGAAGDGDSIGDRPGCRRGAESPAGAPSPASPARARRMRPPVAAPDASRGSAAHRATAERCARSRRRAGRSRPPRPTPTSRRTCGRGRDRRRRGGGAARRSSQLESRSHPCKEQSETPSQRR